MNRIKILFLLPFFFTANGNSATPCQTIQQKNNVFDQAHYQRALSFFQSLPEGPEIDKIVSRLAQQEQVRFEDIAAFVTITSKDSYLPAHLAWLQGLEIYSPRSEKRLFFQKAWPFVGQESITLPHALKKLTGKKVIWQTSPARRRQDVFVIALDLIERALFQSLEQSSWPGAKPSQLVQSFPTRVWSPGKYSAIQTAKLKEISRGYYQMAEIAQRLTGFSPKLEKKSDMRKGFLFVELSLRLILPFYRPMNKFNLSLQDLQAHDVPKIIESRMHTRFYTKWVSDNFYRAFFMTLFVAAIPKIYSLLDHLDELEKEKDIVKKSIDPTIINQATSYDTAMAKANQFLITMLEKNLVTLKLHPEKNQQEIVEVESELAELRGANHTQTQFYPELP